MHDILQSVIGQAVVGLVGMATTALVAYLARLIAKGGSLYEAKTTLEQQAIVRIAASAAVKWAKAKFKDGQGAQKYQAVFDRLQTSYPKFPVNDLEHAIEEAYQEIYGDLRAGLGYPPNESATATI